MKPSVARLLVLLLVACCFGGHLHQALERFTVHEHAGCVHADEDHGTDSGKCVDHDCCLHHHLVATLETTPAFVPPAAALQLLMEEAPQRLPVGLRWMVELPPRLV